MEQRPKIDGNWLYRDSLNEDEPRQFSKLIVLGINDTPWDECTNDTKIAYEEQWHKDHPDPTPEE